MAERLDGLWTEDRDQFFAPFDIDLFYSAGQKPDQAIYWLEQAFTFRNPNLPYLLFPLFDHVRDDPRFKDLCQKMKFPVQCRRKIPVELPGDNVWPVI
jgi:hypothetical protein